jgi:hypothetical protein
MPTIDEVKAAKWRLSVHMDAADHAESIFKSDQVPGLWIVDRCPRGRRPPKARMGRVLMVDGRLDEFTDLAAAVAALNEGGTP